MFVALSLLSAVALAESDWASKVRAVSPLNIVLTEVSEEPDHLRISGWADDNSDISKFMRAISQADLGSPVLEVIRNKDGKRSFILRVEA